MYFLAFFFAALAVRDTVLAKFCMLRQQAEKESDSPYLSQADFIAPKVRATHVLVPSFF